MKTVNNDDFFDYSKRKYGVTSSDVYGQCWSMQYTMTDEISGFICNVIKPKDENITDWSQLIEWNNGKYDKRMDNEDAQNMTDEQFEILRRMALVEDTLKEIYPQ
tara:strand:- start:677 stop:991 length:315 start_codon:yes stop_codon:yes gene_type:complete